MSMLIFNHYLFGFPTILYNDDVYKILLCMCLLKYSTLLYFIACIFSYLTGNFTWFIMNSFE